MAGATIRWRRRWAAPTVAAALAAALFAGLLDHVGPSRPATAAPSAAETPVTVGATAVAGDDRSTTIAVDLDRSAPVSAFLLADPPRLVVDLTHARFAPPKGATGAGVGLVAAWRQGAFAADRGRMVFDTRTPVRIAEATLSAAGGGSRLLLVLEPATVEAMRSAAAVRLGGAAAPAAEAPAPAVAAEAPARAKPLVVVDAGHGGVDAGTVSPATGTPEKVVVLEVAKALARALEGSGRYEVRMTRTADVFVGLGERAAIARAAHADLFVSIHADAEYDHSVRGATVYTLAEKASDERAAALAAKENRSDAIAGLIAEAGEGDVSDILAELTVRETRRFSVAVARDILDEYRRHGRLVKGAAHRQAGLKVLRSHDVPSVLVEIGFLSNKEDEATMKSAEGRDHTVQILTTAIDRWFAGRAGSTKNGDGGAPASP